jgi:NAD(P)H-dependent FMN reductase
MNILILVAGTNDPSNSNTLADAFMEGVRSFGGDMHLEKIRLKDIELAHFTLQHYDPTYPQEEVFKSLQKKIEEADGILIATPIWNFGVPAHLKNLIDRMGSFGLDRETHSRGTFRGKPFFLIFTGGSPLAAWTGLQRKTTSFLPVGLKYFGASVAGTYYEPRCLPRRQAGTKGRGVFGLVVHERPGSLACVQEAGCTFAQIVKKFKDTGKLPLEQALLVRIYKIGQMIVKKL